MQVIVSRSDAKAYRQVSKSVRKVVHDAGLKWCWAHQQYESIANFGKAKGRPDGLQPLCRKAQSQQEMDRRSKRDGYAPRTPKEVRCDAPDGKKWCAHHKGYCDLGDFGRDNRKKDGLQSSCKRGQQEKIKKISTKVSKYNPAPVGTKWCSFHKKFELLDKFRNSLIRERDKSGKAGRCIDGERKYQRPRSIAWGRDNPDKANARNKRRRVNALEGKFDWADIEALLERQDGECASFDCLDDLSAGFEIDHIHPISKGGSNWPSNLQLLCKTCNRSKGGKTMQEWEDYKVQYRVGLN